GNRYVYAGVGTVLHLDERPGQRTESPPLLRRVAFEQSAASRNLRGADAALNGEDLATYRSFADPIADRERKMMAWLRASFHMP
ncbi:hypothetical protein ABTM69_20955, partial [Acinetobacter baumannii]